MDHPTELASHVIGTVVSTVIVVVVLDLLKAAWFEHYVKHQIRHAVRGLVNRWHGTSGRIAPQRIHALLAAEGLEITAHEALSAQPKLEFQPAPAQPLEFDPAVARAFAAEQALAGRPDDPHAIVFADRYLPSQDRALLRVAVVEHYSQLRADKHRATRLILGATNLVILNDGPALLVQERARGVQQGGKLHAFGGGYLPYVLSDASAKNTRRDDRKNLRITASRELAEEAGIYNFGHVPDQLVVLEERWPQRDTMGHLTYAFFLPLDSTQELSMSQQHANWEGIPLRVELGDGTVLGPMIVDGVLAQDGRRHEIHPQFRALLYAWLQLGMPGLALRHFWRINPRRLLQAIDRRIDERLARAA
ncbi:MAG: hypothetical protein HY021_15000 [Burkholderiales bacterium]|nr:hypothetical protein [Burkholderiales bacterium]